MLGRDSHIKIKSTYEVKNIKNAKGRVEVHIDEDSEVEYAGWIEVSAASLY